MTTTAPNRAGVKVGERVGALSHTEGRKLFVFGYGVYLGRAKLDEIDEQPAGPFAAALVDSPLIRLDDGQHVWGCECWWGREEYVREKSKDFEVEMVSIAEKRAACV